MKVTALHALVAAIDEGSLRGAARLLGLSQPAISKTLRELEREVAAPLLVRSVAGVEPTAQGRALYGRARAVLRELEEAVADIRQLGGQMVGEIRVAAVPLALLLLLPPALRTFGREFPEVRMDVREELYIEQLAHLRAGEVDLTLGPVPEDLVSGEFRVEPLAPISMVVVGAPNSPLIKERSLARLASARWVYTSRTGSTGYARRLHELHGLAPPPPVVVANSTLALMSLALGDFVGMMPLQITRHPAAAPFMREIPIKEGPLELNLGAIVRKDAMLKPIVRHFLAHLHRAAWQEQRRGATPESG